MQVIVGHARLEPEEINIVNTTQITAKIMTIKKCCTKKRGEMCGV